MGNPSSIVEMCMQIVDPASGAARVLEAIAQATLDAYTPRIQVRHALECRYFESRILGCILTRSHTTPMSSLL